MNRREARGFEGEAFELAVDPHLATYREVGFPFPPDFYIHKRGEKICTVSRSVTLAEQLEVWESSRPFPTLEHPLKLY